MKKYFNRSGLAVLAAAAFLTACDPEIDAPEISKGEADFTRYVAIGNSLTAGYGDGGLYRESQLNSFPNILAGQFKLAGGGEFTQPLFSEAQKNGSGYLRLTGFSPSGSPIVQPVTTELAIRGTSAAGGPLYTKYTDPVNNLGVPGMSVLGSTTPLFGSEFGNPYFERLLDANEAGNKSYQQVVAESNPTFFTCWLGNMDVLTYATSGGVSSATNPFSGITDEAIFASAYNSMITNLTKNGAKGALATIPDVTLIPFFNTVGPTFKATLVTNNIPTFVALTGSGNARRAIPTASIKDASEGIVLFTLNSSSYLSLVGQPTGKYWRDQARANGTPLATILSTYGISDTTKMFGLSLENPLPSSFLLDDTELNEIKTATTKFNNIIQTAAVTNNLALFEVNGFFQSIQPVDGKAVLVVNAVNYTPAFISGNLFSLDGVHLTPRGYALVANEFIKVINAKYKASIPTVNINNYNAVLFP